MLYNSSILDNTSDQDMKLLCEVMSLATKVRDYAKGLSYAKHLTFECHSICRAISMALPKLKCIDGSYAGLERIPAAGVVFELQYTDHSWLLTPDGAIIDPYPVGYISVNPVIVVTKGQYSPFGGKLYVEDSRITTKVSARKLWRKSQVLYKMIQAAKKAS